MIIVAIGANLPGLDGETVWQACTRAAGAVAAIPELTLAAVSAWYRTVPVPKSDQPDYCNGVVRLDGEITPEDLLARLHRIEADFGRHRNAPNAARTMDLDIIDLNGLVRPDQDPILPHPRAHLRRFVLRPLLDVAPAWRHPALNRSVTSLLVDLTEGGIAPW